MIEDTGGNASAASDGSSSRRVAVVGGAGFLGSHLVDRLLLDGDRVDVLDDLSAGSLGNLAEARATAGAGSGTLKIHHVDGGGPEAAALLATHRPEVLYVLAGVPSSATDPRQVTAALDRLVVLLEAARASQVHKIVTVIPGSVVYGVPAVRDLPVKERELIPRGIRGVVARAMVDLLDVYRDSSALEYTAIALGTVYGPRQRPDAGVVAAFLDAHRHRRAPRITGDGRQTRDLVHVDDAVDALDRAGRRGSGLVINVGTGVQTSLRELWIAIAGAGGVDPEWAPARHDELVRFSLSPVRARIHLGWSPWTSLTDGLAAMRIEHLPEQ